ncbi:MAG: hypothetical protein IPG47_17365 [Thermoflexaceae bacterium]|nr:hypothetical protein [Thermoflexaceae bacterium]
MGSSRSTIRESGSCHSRLDHGSPVSAAAPSSTCRMSESPTHATCAISPGGPFSRVTTTPSASTGVGLFVGVAGAGV